MTSPAVKGTAATGGVHPVYEFGPFVLEVRERRLLRDGETIPLRAKVFETLRVLVENHGRLVTKDDLLKAVWPDTLVEEGNLAHCLSVIRKALGDRETGRQHVETVPGQGYRFIAGVRARGGEPEPAPSGATPEPAAAAWQERLEAALATLAGKGPLRVPEAVAPVHVVGRDRELGDVVAAWETACSGQAVVVCLAGEPGIGKSTLFQHFLEGLRGSGTAAAVALGQCSEFLAESEAYLPVLEALESLLAGPAGRETGELLKLLAPTWYVQVAPLWAAADPTFAAIVSDAKTASRERMKRELAAFLRDLTRIQPTILFIDDLHWADASTSELLAYLPPRLAAERLLIVVTYRVSEMLAGRHPFVAVRDDLRKQRLCREIDLARLGRDDVQSYLSLELPGQDLSQDLVDLVHRRTEGNALFMVDLVRHLRDQQALERPLEEIGNELPESIRSMIQRRLDQLEESELTLLSVAAVQGVEFDSQVVCDVLRMMPNVVEERLRRLERVHFFVRFLREKELPDGSLSLHYAFTHSLYQHGMYAHLTPSQRVQLSRLSAQALLSHYRESFAPVASQLGILFEAAREFEHASDFFLAAASNAARLFANEEAVRLTRRAIAAAGKLSGRDRHARVLAASMQVAQLHLLLSRFEDAATAFETAEKAAEALGDVESRVNAICAGAIAQFYQRRMETTRQYAGRALEMARTAGSELGAASAELVLGLERMCYGDTAEAEQRFARSVPILKKQVPAPHALEAIGFSGLLEAWQLDYGSAGRAVNWSLEKARELGLSYHIVMNLFVRGMMLFNQGHLSEGLNDLFGGIRLAEKNRERFWLSRFPNTLGWVYRELQDFESALRFDAEGAQTARENGYAKPEANSHLNLAQDYAAVGESYRALDHLERAGEIFEADVWFRWRYNIRLKAELASYWLLKGDTRLAGRYAAESVALAEPRKARKHLAWAYKVLGDVAAAEERFLDARREYDTALGLLGQYRCPTIEWKVLLAAAEMASAHRDVDRAEHYRGRCRQVIHSLADSLTDEKLRRQFLRSEAIRSALL